MLERERRFKHGREKTAAYICHGECVERHISRCVLNIKERGGDHWLSLRKFTSHCAVLYCTVLLDLDALSHSLSTLQIILLFLRLAIYLLTCLPSQIKAVQLLLLSSR